MSPVLMGVFIALAFLALLGSLLMLLNRDAIFCVLGMVLAMLSLGGLYIVLGLPYMGIFQIIAYAGAVMVMFLYVVMLMGRDEPANPVGKLQIGLSWLASFGLVAILFRSLGRVNSPWVERAGFGAIADMGHEILAKYILPFELVSVLLLAAMVGVVVLAVKEKR